MEKTAYAPGESGEIHAELNTTGFKGKVRKSIRVKSNANDGKSVGLTLEADVIYDLEPRQTRIVFRNAQPGSSFSESVEITNRSGKPLEIASYNIGAAEKTKAPFRLAVEAVRNEGKDYVKFALEIADQVDLPERTVLPVQVLFEGAKTNYAHFTIQVKAIAAWTVEPSIITLRNMLPGKRDVAEILVTSNKGPLKHVTAHCSVDIVELEQVVQDQQTVAIRLHMKKDLSTETKDISDNGWFSGVISIESNTDEKSKTFSIPLRGRLILVNRLRKGFATAPSNPAQAPGNRLPVPPAKR